VAIKAWFNRGHLGGDRWCACVYWLQAQCNPSTRGLASTSGRRALCATPQRAQPMLEPGRHQGLVQVRV